MTISKLEKFLKRSYEQTRIIDTKLLGFAHLGVSLDTVFAYFNKQTDYSEELIKHRMGALLIYLKKYTVEDEELGLCQEAFIEIQNDIKDFIK